MSNFKDMIFEEMTGHKVEEDNLYQRGYKQGRNDAIEEVIAMFKADFDKQNRVNSLYVPTVVVNENIYIDLEQLKENYEK